MKKLTSSLTSLLVGSVLAFSGTAALAAACTTYVNGATSTYLGTDDVTINTLLATDCYGHASVGANSVADVQSFANTTDLFGTADWTGFLRANATDTTGTGTYSGISFTLSGLTVAATGGTFTLTLTDLFPLTDPNLPLTMDLLFTLKAATGTDFYFFDDIVLSASNGGTYQVSITNRNGQLQNLSDITLLGRDPTGCQQGDPACTTTVPAPATLALLGLGALGLGFSRRRKQA